MSQPQDTQAGESYRTYPCAKCGKANASWLAFYVGRGRRRRWYCLGHIPWYVRLSMRLRGVK